MFDRRARRKIKAGLFIGFCVGSTVVALIALVAILASLLFEGVGGLNLAVFTQSTPAPGSMGGLLNAIVGSLMMCSVAMIGAMLVGVLAGTWLAEYSADSNYAKIVRFMNDVLLSAPSILVGLFVYEIVVAPAHGFSGWAGALALALLAAPVVTRTTEDVLKLQSKTLRESGVALGTPLGTTIRKILWRAAASSPAACWPSPVSPAKPRRCCSPRWATSFSAWTWASPSPICRW